MASKVQSESKYYSRVIVSKGLRFTVAVAVCFAMLAVAYLIAQGMANKGSWLTFSAPIGLIGLVLISLPMIEYWEYRPWQNAPMRYEQNVK